MNQVILTGRIVHKNELKNGGISLAISLLNNKNSQDGYIDVVSFGKLAETIKNIFHDGTRVGIVGHIEKNKKEVDGEKLYFQNIYIDTIEFLEKKPKEPIEKEEIEQEL